jgi:hypothetical protein
MLTATRSFVKPRREYDRFGAWFRVSVTSTIMSRSRSTMVEYDHDDEYEYEYESG